jgi:uncharacterized protein YjbI with pentapeptide repeats
LLEISTDDLRKADLSHSNLSGAVLSGANMHHARLRGADLRGANLTKANLTGADLRGANLTEANLIGADLRGASMLLARLTRADLRGADLRGADLRYASLIGLRDWAAMPVDLREAALTDILNGVLWSDTTRWPWGTANTMRQLSEELRPGEWRVVGSGSANAEVDTPQVPV